ncbi:JmjC domain-containing protein [Pseudoalteromonas prydzensis]|uniref:JmjC domain-containing protein n=1 Tax=Pseudoalteromonas prydzensis TaxID=182141 RepID=UPI0007E510EB|nr:cupin domain-containing protein [Pseudoalteromonas prydzensis]MBE0377193.1 hypothetical protein [Pseudoalteromonas prydzensis ACAM 620]
MNNQNNALNELDMQRISALLYPLSIEEFMRDKWPGNFQCSTGPVERLAELIEHPDFNSIDTLVRAPGIGDIRADFTRVQRQSRLVTPEHAVELYHSGCTIYTNNFASDVIQSWKKTLDTAFGLIPGRAQVNAFASTSGTGLPWHWDSQEIFIVQVKGKKRWHVAPNEDIDWPTLGGRPGAESRADIKHQFRTPGKPVAEPKEWDTVDLEPGSVMFLPRGYWHRTENIDSSIHIVLQVNLMNWRDVFLYLLENIPAFHSAEWRKPTLALTPDKLMTDGLQEFQARCGLFNAIATPQGLAELAQLYSSNR